MGGVGKRDVVESDAERVGSVEAIEREFAFAFDSDIAERDVFKARDEVGRCAEGRIVRIEEKRVACVADADVVIDDVVD